MNLRIGSFKKGDLVKIMILNKPNGEPEFGLITRISVDSRPNIVNNRIIFTHEVYVQSTGEKVLIVESDLRMAIK